MDIETTTQTVTDMANTMRQFAEELDRIAERMNESRDISHAGEAANCVTNCFLNLRLDLLVVRPMRAYEQEIRILKGASR